MARKRLDPNAVYVCWESFAGDELSCRRGATFRGDHKIVVAHPYFFTLASEATDDKLAALRMEHWRNSGATAPV
jgi:hypothetical protein